MKILISGGVKTQNIVDGLTKKFTTSGVEFIVVPFIEDIENIYHMGQYFDRAVIIEQCWTRDDEIQDNVEKRNKINAFAHSALERNDRDVEYVFLTQTEKEAEMVHEEILPIISDSTVVVKAPRYTVTFFAMLATLDIEKIDPEIVYTGLSYEEKIVEDTNDEIELDEYDLAETDDIEAELFGDMGDNLFEDVFSDNMWDDEHELVDQDEELDEIDIEEDTIIEQDIQEDIEEEQEERGNSTNDFEFDGDIWDESELDFDIEDLEDELTSAGVEDYNSQLEQEEIYLDEPIKNKENVGIIDIDSDSLLSNTDYEFETGEEKCNEDETIKDKSNIGNTDSENIDKQKKSKINVVKNTKDKKKQRRKKERKKKEHTIKENNSKKQEYNIRETLDAFAARGNSIVVTGCGGSGNSTISHNIANTLVNVGYACLVVDMDVKGRAQSYISKDNHDSIDDEDTSLISAMNSSYGVQAHVAIAKPGLHLLTMGMGTEIRGIEEILNKEKMARFANQVRNHYNFIIYDMPFDVATKFASDITFMSDNIVITIDSSTWGITKTMLNVCNVELEDMQETLFGRAQIIYNRHKGLDRIFDRKIKDTSDIAKAIDSKIFDIIGEDTGYYFEHMHVSGVIDRDDEIDLHWMENGAYSDTPKGKEIFTEIILNILLKR